jgi:ketosteroid isomerase-like protein
MVLIRKDTFFDDVATAFAAGDPNVGQKSVEAEHVHCIQLLYHAIARGAFDEMLQLTTPDFTLDIVGPETSKLVGVTVGREKVLETLKRNFGYFSEQTPHIETVVAQGDTVVIIAHEHGKMLPDKTPYQVQWVQIFTFAGDRVAKVRQIFDGVEKFSCAQLP